MSEASEKLDLARSHLERVQTASWDPVDWTDLSLYAFYALENGVVAAAEHLGIAWQKNHPDKARVAGLLHEQYGLPDVSELLRELNQLRKNLAYGEGPRPGSLDAEDTAIAVEEFVEAVATLVGGDDSDV
jgi:hypothetical protein